MQDYFQKNQLLIVYTNQRNSNKDIPIGRETSKCSLIQMLLVTLDKIHHDSIEHEFNLGHLSENVDDKDDDIL